MSLKRRIIRAISFLRKTDPITNIFQEYKFYTVFELHIAEIFREVFQTIRNDTFEHKYKSNSMVNRPTTRSVTKGKLAQLSLRSNARKQSITNKVFIAYNILQELDITSVQYKNLSLRAFKSFFKSFTDTYILGASDMQNNFFRC